MTCSVQGCGRPVDEVGMCHKHYEYNRRHGYPEPLPRPSAVERILSRIIIDENDCWIWPGASGSKGHGHLCVLGEDGQKRWVCTHRIVYEALVGPIPDGLQLDHLCRKPPCCNPAHLEPVDYVMMPAELRRIEEEHGPWCES